MFGWPLREHGEGEGEEEKGKTRSRSEGSNPGANQEREAKPPLVNQHALIILDSNKE